MALTPDQLRMLAQGEQFTIGPAAQEPKRGEEIFEGTDYPREWSGFIGQDRAKEQLQIQIASANARSARLEHTLLDSGTHGIGKSTLATLLAHKAGVGITATTGPLDADDARRLMKPMKDRDVLFIDEAHTLVQGGRNKGDWLLPFMTEGRLYTSIGVHDSLAMGVSLAHVTAIVVPVFGAALWETLGYRFPFKERNWVKKLKANKWYQML